MRKRAFTLRASRSNDRNATREAVANGHVAQGESGNAAAIHADLQRTPPGPAMVIAAAAQQFAVPHNRRAAEVIVYLEVPVGCGECRADEHPAPGGDIGETTFLDAVVGPPIDRGTIRKEGQLARAVTNDVVSRLWAVPHEALV